MPERTSGVERMSYGTRVVMAFLGGSVFVSTLVFVVSASVPAAGGGLGAHAVFAGAGFGVLTAAFVRAD